MDNSYIHVLHLKVFVSFVLIKFEMSVIFIDLRPITLKSGGSLSVFSFVSFEIPYNSFIQRLARS